MKKKIVYLWRYIFWGLSRIFVYTYLVPKFNLKIDKDADPIPNPPFIMISNHATFFDPWLIGHFSKYPLSIMMNEDGFKASAFTRWYQTQIGCFPKKKGASDYRAMKITLRMLKQGYAALIFPEGQTTWDGETQPIYPGVEKIVKFSKASLVMMHVRGNFLSKPWWADSFRKGSLHISRKVLKPEDIKSMSDKELLESIIKYINNNDIKDDITKKVTFSGYDLAKGLERFVWMCPFCEKEDCLTTDKNTISCSACEHSWDIDSHFNFKPNQNDANNIGDLHDLASWHKKKVKEKIASAGQKDILTKSDNAMYCNIDDHGRYLDYTSGRLILTKEEIVFKPAEKNDYAVRCSVDDIDDYVWQRKSDFEFRIDGKNYRFRFTNQSPMKWVYYFRYLNDFEKCEDRGYL